MQKVFLIVNSKNDTFFLEKKPYGFSSVKKTEKASFWEVRMPPKEMGAQRGIARKLYVLQDSAWRAASFVAVSHKRPRQDVAVQTTEFGLLRMTLILRDGTLAVTAMQEVRRAKQKHRIRAELSEPVCEKPKKRRHKKKKQRRNSLVPVHGDAQRQELSQEEVERRRRKYAEYLERCARRGKRVHVPQWMS